MSSPEIERLLATLQHDRDIDRLHVVAVRRALDEFEVKLIRILAPPTITAYPTQFHHFASAQAALHGSVDPEAVVALRVFVHGFGSRMFSGRFDACLRLDRISRGETATGSINLPADTSGLVAASAYTSEVRLKQLAPILT